MFRGDILTNLGIDPPKKIIELGPHQQGPDQHEHHRLDTPVQAASGVPTGQTPESVSSINISCGTRGRGVVTAPAEPAAPETATPRC